MIKLTKHRNNMIRELSEKDKNNYNKSVSHIIQSWEWGEFRKKIGTDLVRIGDFRDRKLTAASQITFHPVPLLKNITIGYLPKGPMPTKNMVDALVDLGGKKKAAVINIEPY